MRRFPDEFESVLSARGLRVLAGRDPACGVLARGSRFVLADNLLRRAVIRAAPALLARAFEGLLRPMERPIPPTALIGATRNYGELLPKTARVSSALLASTRSRAWARAVECGVVPMLRSPSFHAFVERLSGFALRRTPGVQVLCYGPGDYAGPHTDHHPEDAEARDGYVDCHLTFSTRAVDSQWLVYEQGGHFSEAEPIATPGTLTCYRLPFWHYTTPLLPRAGQAALAKRWLLLGTFLDAAKRRQAGASRARKTS